jgi:hypothetical protein
MKPIAFVFLAMFLSSFSGYRTVHFGLPENQAILKKNDLIIMNIPNNINGRFVASSELSSLISFINKIPNEVEIRINVFYLEKSHCKKYSDFLASNLQEIFSDSIDKKNYLILSYGATDPFFCDTTTFDYKTINTRIDLIIGE